MTSKGSVNKKESKGNNSKSSKSHRSNEVNSTADKFGIWSTVTRVFLAFLVVVSKLFSGIFSFLESKA